MLDIFLTAEAKYDLHDIHNYIARNNLNAAIKIIEDIYKAFDQIALYPFSGNMRLDLTIKNLRFKYVRSYVIIYDPHTDPVKIIRVLNSHRNIKNMIH